MNTVRDMVRAGMTGAVLLVIAALLYAAWLGGSRLRESNREEYKAACLALGGKPLITSFRMSCYVPGHQPLEK